MNIENLNAGTAKITELIGQLSREVKQQKDEADLYKRWWEEEKKKNDEIEKKLNEKNEKENIKGVE